MGDVNSILIFIIIAFLLIAVLWKLPIYQHRGLPNTVSDDRKAEIIDKSRATWAQVFAGAFFLITAYFTWKGLQNTEQGQITDRYTKAIQLLSTPNTTDTKAVEVAHVGGVYALERISQDSSRDYWPVIQTLANFVRVNGLNSSQSITERLDMQAALYVIGRRDYKQDVGSDDPYRYDKRLDFGGVYLNDSFLQHAHLDGALLISTSLENAHMDNASLNNCALIDAHLSKANLDGAQLRDADLRGADLKGADLRGAHLHLAHLEGADLRSAKDIHGKDIPTNMQNADLTEAFLRDVKYDNTTVWPTPEFEPQKHGAPPPMAVPQTAPPSSSSPTK